MTEEPGFVCPRCKRKGLVRLHSDADIFECLYCRHTEDLSRDTGLGSASNWIVMGLLGIMVGLAMVLG